MKNLMLLATALFNLGVWFAIGFIVVHFAMKFW